MGLLDFVLTYECNLACDYCTVAPGRRAALPAAAVLAALRDGRAAGYDAVAYTGGEPTLRRDLPALVRAARDLGYGSVKLQSNGLLYAHAPNVDRLLEAGATLFHVSVHAHEEARYERIVRRPGTHRLMRAGLEHLVARGVALRAELIVDADTWRALPGAVRWLAGLGVRAVDFWYVSLTDANRENVASLPPMAEAVPAVREALAAARAAGMDSHVLYVPRCLLGDDEAHAHDPGAGRVRVVTPEATFELAASRLRGSVHVPACQGCRFRERCPGLRPDYLGRFGDGEIAAARAAGAGAPAQGGSGASSSS